MVAKDFSWNRVHHVGKVQYVIRAVIRNALSFRNEPAQQLVVTFICPFSHEENGCVKYTLVPVASAAESSANSEPLSAVIVLKISEKWAPKVFFSCTMASETAAAEWFFTFSQIAYLCIRSTIVRTAGSSAFLLPSTESNSNDRIHPVFLCFLGVPRCFCRDFCDSPAPCVLWYSGVVFQAGQYS